MGRKYHEDLEIEQTALDSFSVETKGNLRIGGAQLRCHISLAFNSSALQAS